MRKPKIPDPKMAPRNWDSAKAPKKGLSETHHEAVLAAFAIRYKDRDESYRSEALAFLEDWKANQAEGYYAQTPGQLLLATTVAVSARRGMRAREQELHAAKGDSHGNDASAHPRHPAPERAA